MYVREKSLILFKFSARVQDSWPPLEPFTILNQVIHLFGYLSFVVVVVVLALKGGRQSKHDLNKKLLGQLFDVVQLCLHDAAIVLHDLMQHKALQLLSAHIVSCLQHHQNVVQVQLMNDLAAAHLLEAVIRQPIVAWWL